MEKKQFTWVDYYMELADKLLVFKQDRPTLIQKLINVYASINMPFPKLEEGELLDIDPFTVFGLFNKGITDTNKMKIVMALAEEFAIEADVPHDFDGVPILNNLNATFYAFTGDPRRREQDIDNLWRIFEAELALSENDGEKERLAFTKAFDGIAGQFGIGWKITMGLYWARPFCFISMDSRNRWYLGDRACAGEVVAAVFPKEKDSPIWDGLQYLEVCDVVASQIKINDYPFNSFPAVSYAAFIESDRVNKEKKAKEKAAAKKAEDGALGDAGVESIQYWLFTPGSAANMWDEFFSKGIMGIGWSELGDLSAYQTKDEMRLKLIELTGGVTSQKNAAHAAWQFAHELKPGDVVFVKQGRTKILGRGIVAGDYEYNAAAGQYSNIRRVTWLNRGEWSISQSFATKTLTDITDYTDLVQKINLLFQDDQEEGAEEEIIVDLPAYSKEDFLSEVFMSEDRYENLVGILRAKKNVILQGAPGVGKTFAAKRLAYSMMGLKDPHRVMMVQFHQSYSYEDFIEGYRPSEDGFELCKGAFYSFCKRATDDGDNDYFFIIDEINRGNLSKIFGELFMLIENDKRGPKNKLQLLYSRELFYVPSNVYLIGMMNTADRSLAMLDYALRRRFAFFNLEPGFSTDGFSEYRKSLANPKFDEFIACVTRLNQDIAEDETLGEGFAFGHSYFCGLDKNTATDSKLAAIVEYELIPMVKEYWFDDQAKVRDWSEMLRRAIR